jgi:hypothetical protein
LSHHGMNVSGSHPTCMAEVEALICCFLLVPICQQAKALGESFKQTRADVVIASPLLRALWTVSGVFLAL